MMVDPFNNPSYQELHKAIGKLMHDKRPVSEIIESLVDCTINFIECLSIERENKINIPKTIASFLIERMMKGDHACPHDLQ